MVQKIQEKCPEISETVELPKCEFTHMILEIPGAKLDGKKTSGKNFSNIWVYLARLSSFLEIFKKAVPFTTESCRKF